MTSILAALAVTLTLGTFPGPVCEMDQGLKSGAPVGATVAQWAPYGLDPVTYGLVDYDADGRVLSESLLIREGVVGQRWDYEYDDLGRLVGRYRTSATSTGFEVYEYESPDAPCRWTRSDDGRAVVHRAFDALGRLVEVRRVVGGVVSETFRYQYGGG